MYTHSRIVGGAYTYKLDLGVYCLQRQEWSLLGSLFSNRQLESQLQLLVRVSQCLHDRVLHSVFVASQIRKDRGKVRQGTKAAA